MCLTLTPNADISDSPGSSTGLADKTSFPAMVPTLDCPTGVCFRETRLKRLLRFSAPPLRLRRHSAMCSHRSKDLIWMPLSLLALFQDLLEEPGRKVLTLRIFGSSWQGHDLALKMCALLLGKSKVATAWMLDLRVQRAQKPHINPSYPNC